MLTIKTDAVAQASIRSGNMEVLKVVLEQESEKMREALVSQANSDTFRFQQGQAQAIDAVLKLLP